MARWSHLAVEKKIGVKAVPLQYTCLKPVCNIQYLSLSRITASRRRVSPCKLLRLFRNRTRSEKLSSQRKATTQRAGFAIQSQHWKLRNQWPSSRHRWKAPRHLHKSWDAFLPVTGYERDLIAWRSKWKHLTGRTLGQRADEFPLTQEQRAANT